MIHCQQCPTKKECYKDTLEIIKFFKQELKGDDHLSDKLSVDSLIIHACYIGGHDLAMNKVTTHQIRRFFTAFKSIQEALKDNSLNQEIDSQNRAKLLMLKPQLANAVGKERNKDTKESLSNLLEILTLMFKHIKYKKDYDLFMNFFESIVAYHKAYS